jgi:hypothetical protein
MRKSIYLSYLCIAVIGLWLAPGQACSPAAITPSPGSGSTFTMALESTAFTNDAAIPVAYTQDGADISPPLEWFDVPAGTKELAIIMEDTDTGPVFFVHWVIYKIPATLTGLPADVPTGETLINPQGALQGLNSGFGSGYLGPQPPQGVTHHYRFTLYALSAPLDVPAGLDAAGLRANMQGNIITETTLVGTFAR